MARVECKPFQRWKPFTQNSRRIKCGNANKHYSQVQVVAPNVIFLLNLPPKEQILQNQKTTNCDQKQPWQLIYHSD